MLTESDGISDSFSEENLRLSPRLGFKTINLLILRLPCMYKAVNLSCVDIFLLIFALYG